MKQIQIMGQGIESVSPYITAQRRVNVYYDVRPDGDKNQVVLISSPGLTLLLTLPTFPIRGMVQDGQYAYILAGNTLYLVSPYGGYSVLGTIYTDTPTPVTMKFNETQLCIVDGSYGYVLNNVPQLVALAANQVSYPNLVQAQLVQDFQFLRDIQSNNIS